MSEPLARLRAVLEAATPGPWVRSPGLSRSFVRTERGTVIGGHPLDARAIAVLGTLWPDLLALAEAAEDDAIAVDTTQGVNQALRALVAAIDAALPEVTDEGG